MLYPGSVLTKEIDALVFAQMTETIDVEHAVTTIDEFGQTVTTWEPLYAGEDAMVVQESASEAIRSDRIEADEAYTIKMHFYDDITSDERVVWNGKTLQIHGPPRDVQNTGTILEILASRSE